MKIPTEFMNRQSLRHCTCRTLFVEHHHHVDSPSLATCNRLYCSGEARIANVYERISFLPLIQTLSCRLHVHSCAGSLRLLIIKSVPEVIFLVSYEDLKELSAPVAKLSPNSFWKT